MFGLKGELFYMINLKKKKKKKKNKKKTAMN